MWLLHILTAFLNYVMQVLLRMLAAYYNHVRAFENTLVIRFYGLHCVKLTGTIQKKVRSENNANLKYKERVQLGSSSSSSLFFIAGAVCHYGKPILFRVLYPQTL